jgi:hypothetical protein
MNILNDSTVSYNAIGLYSQMQASPEDVPLTLDYLTEMHQNDREAVVSGIDELVKAGWLRVGPMKKDGKFVGYFWQFLNKEISQ